MAVIFDTGQPRGVIACGCSGFEAVDFSPGQDRTQVFLSWELPVEDPDVARALGIAWGTDPSGAVLQGEEQVWPCGAPARVCPVIG